MTVSNLRAYFVALFFLISTLAQMPLVSAAAFDIDFEEVAPGVWAGVRPDGPRFPVMGTSVFVISEAGVVVFDGGGMPVMADKVIDKIRSLTDRPVTHVIISHWHGDHNFGNYRYAEEFPNVEFVAQTFTDAVMHGTRIRYIDSYPEFISKNLPGFKVALEKGVHPDGNPVRITDRKDFERAIADADQIDAEFKRARITLPTVVFEESLTIRSGDREIELLTLGHGNTEGDVVMWLPKERVVATGDLVVLPTPYAFNVPPRPWATALRNLNALNYAVLIPGHGAIQHDTTYVDLNIEAAESIADQRDAMLKQNLSHEEIQEQLDFTPFKERFTGGDAYVEGYYDDYFENPFRAAAIKALTGKPMVTIDRE